MYLQSRVHFFVKRNPDDVKKCVVKCAAHFCSTYVLTDSQNVSMCTSINQHHVTLGFNCGL